MTAKNKNVLQNLKTAQAFRSLESIPAALFFLCQGKVIRINSKNVCLPVI
jgi:hypothetical protein